VISYRIEMDAAGYAHAGAPVISDALTIDPGYAEAGEGCACAVSYEGRLTAVWFERPTNGGLLEWGHGPSVQIVQWEKPQTDGRTYVCGPSVVIELAAQGGTLAGLYGGRFECAVEAVTPRKWKGSVQKPIQHKALWEILTDAERDLLGGATTRRMILSAVKKGALHRWNPKIAYYPGKWITHNLLDAAAMNARLLGRF
jgi:hypothetical protein